MIKKDRAAARRPPLNLPPCTSSSQASQTPRPSIQQSQFNATPRFAFPSTPRPQPAPTPSQNARPTPSQAPSLPRTTPAASRYLTPAPKREIDAIETSFEKKSSDEDEEIVHDSIERDHNDEDTGYVSADAEDDYMLLERSPKRRRISTSIDIEQAEAEEPLLEQDENETLSSSLPILSSPPVPRQPLSKAIPRFITPALPASPQSSSTTHYQPQTFLRPPRFRPPDPSELAGNQGDPLPDQFSPHRKGQKYIPGGLAAEVRDWLVNIESAIPISAASTMKEDPWLVKMVVNEGSGGQRSGMTLVRGRQIVQISEKGEGHMPDNLGEVKVMLAGEGQATGLQKGSKVEIGKIIGIKGPIWEVVIDGEKWGVGVDWKVLG